MEGEVPGWLALVGNLGGLGVLIWFLVTRDSRNEKKNEVRDAAHKAEVDGLKKDHAAEIADKNKEIIACRDAQIATLKEVLMTTSNNNTVISTMTAVVTKLGEQLTRIETPHVHKN